MTMNEAVKLVNDTRDKHEMQRLFPSVADALDTPERRRAFAYDLTVSKLNGRNFDPSDYTISYNDTYVSVTVRPIFTLEMKHWTQGEIANELHNRVSMLLTRFGGCATADSVTWWISHF